MVFTLIYSGSATVYLLTPNAVLARSIPLCGTCDLYMFEMHDLRLCSFKADCALSGVPDELYGLFNGVAIVTARRVKVAGSTQKLGCPMRASV